MVMVIWRVGIGIYLLTGDLCKVAFVVWAWFGSYLFCFVGWML